MTAAGGNYQLISLIIGLKFSRENDKNVACVKGDNPPLTQAALLFILR